MARKKQKSKAQAKQPMVSEAYIDPLFLKSADDILEKYIQDELAKSNADPDKTSLRDVERKKFIISGISLAISLILAVLMKFFHSLDWLCHFLIFLNIMFCVIFCRRLSLTKMLMSEAKIRPDEDISNVVASCSYDFCPKRGMLRLLAYPALLLLLPNVFFINPHFFYEDGPGGKYLRYYTEGWAGGNDVVVPESVDGVKVMGLRGDVFAYTSITSVELPDGIDTIRGHAFEGCSQLRSINLPSSLRYIGGYAFSGCSSLQSVSFPKYLSEIGGNAFEGCSSLTFGSLPPLLTEIRAYCFSGCSSISKVVVPDGVSRIGASAFRGCSSLSELVLPESLQEIGSSAFRNCGSLDQELVLPQGCNVSERAFKDSPTVLK